MIQKNKPAWTFAPLGGDLRPAGTNTPLKPKAWMCRDNQDESDDWTVIKVDPKVFLDRQDDLDN